jgi:hypothetical protein
MINNDMKDIDLDKLTNTITSEDILKIIYNNYKYRYIKEKCDKLNERNKAFWERHKWLSMKFSAKILEYMTLKEKNKNLPDYEFDLLYL